MWVGRFKEGARGNVAVTFAITAVVLIGMVGAGISYSTAIGVRSRLQEPLDASVLAGTALPAAAPAAKRLAAAQQYFASNLPSSADTPVFAVEGFTVTGSAGATVESPFLALLASKGIPVSVAATAVKEESDPICVLALNPQASD